MSLSVIVAYCHPSINHAVYQPMARRFVQTYTQHPPGDYPHQVVVLVNGSKYPALPRVFDPLPVTFMEHNNLGKDLGAYERAAHTLPCDLLVCLGAPVFFHRAGWLDWIVRCYLDNGPGFYGAFAYQVPLPHIRTTCFWCHPELLKAYPYFISDSSRYQVEHGPDSYTLWAQRLGFPTLMVTWDGVYAARDWQQMPKSKCLMWDQHVERHHPP